MTAAPAQWFAAALFAIALIFTFSTKFFERLAHRHPRNFTEPLFVFAIMVVAGSRPILELASSLVRGFSRLLPTSPSLAAYSTLFSLVPLLGSHHRADRDDAGSPDAAQRPLQVRPTGGGLTVIANAPNPAGFSILKVRFEDETISPRGLLLAALPPTGVAIVAMRYL